MVDFWAFSRLAARRASEMVDSVSDMMDGLLFLESESRPVGGGGRLQHLEYRTGLLSAPILGERDGRLELVKWGGFASG